MEKSRKFTKVVSCHSLARDEPDNKPFVSCVRSRSRSVEPFPRLHNDNLEPSSSTRSHTLCEAVQDDDSKDPVGDTIAQLSTASSSVSSVASDGSLSSKSVKVAVRSVHHHKLSQSQTVHGDVKDDDTKGIVEDTVGASPQRSTSTTSYSANSVSSEEVLPSDKFIRVVHSMHHYEEKQCVVSSCPTVSVHRCLRDFARKWSSAGIPTALSYDDITDESIAVGSDDSSNYSTDDFDGITEENKDTSSGGKPSRVDFSNVFRERSKTWAGEEIRPYKSKSLYSMRSTRSYGDENVVIYYLDNPRGKGEHFTSGDHNTDPRPCVCRPSQPPSDLCTSLDEEEDEPNEMIYLKQVMIWVTFLIKLILFTSLWVLLLYWFLMSAGFVNVVREPVVLQTEWNTYIDKLDEFKLLVIDNTFDSAELEVRMQGPFADSNVFFNCQFERLYFLKDKFNQTDVKIVDAEEIEVDHRLYEDSYSAVTSTTTRISRSTSFTYRSWYYWTEKRSYEEFYFLFFTRRRYRSYWTWDWYYPSKSMSVTGWTFTTLTARLTRYNLSRHPMTTFTVHEPYNFVPWGNVRMYGYTFRNFRAVGGRLRGHRHYANKTPDSNMTVTYGFKYALNMSTMIDLLNNTELDTVAFAIEITKGMRYTTTTTTVEPPIVIKKTDGVKYGLLLMGLILALLFLQTNRVLALFIIAVACASVLSFLKIRPGPETVVAWLNLDYIFELLFVMTLVAATADTGFYDIVSFIIYKLCLGSLFAITFVMCVCSFTLAVFMDGVAAILCMTPIAIRTVEQGQMNPTPVLLSMILFCNMAGVLDADYNYVNYNIIKSYGKWQATEAAFQDIKFHQKMMPGVIVSAAATTVYLLLVFRLLKPHVYTIPEPAMLVHRQTLLRIAASGINRNSKTWDEIRAQLIEWHHEIDEERLRRLNDIEPPPDRERFNKITDVVLLMKIGLVLVIFFVLFGLKRHGVYGLGAVSIGMIVVACTGYLLILINYKDMNSLFRRFQWCTIIGLISIFYIEGSFEIMRLNKRIFQLLSGFLPENKAEIPFSAMRYLQWGSLTMSVIFSNFGAATTMRLVAARFGNILPNHVADLVYAVTFGCNVGGSATVLGTGVSIACTASAWQQGYRVSACKYMIFMFPITLVNMLCIYFIWAGLGN